MEGNGPKDPLFIQIKEEAASSYAPYLGGATVPLTTKDAGWSKASGRCKSNPTRCWDGR